MRCLLLDAAMRPMTLVSRERAVSLVVCGNAQVIAEEPSVVYRSEHLSVALIEKAAHALNFSHPEELAGTIELWLEDGLVEGAVPDGVRLVIPRGGEAG